MKKKKVEFSSHTAQPRVDAQLRARFLNGYPFSEKERMLMVLGVDEACTNIIRYAYHLRDDQLISLSMEGLRNCVRMRLRDYGEQVLPRRNERPLARYDQTGRARLASDSQCFRRSRLHPQTPRHRAGADEESGVMEYWSMDVQRR